MIRPVPGCLFVVGTPLGNLEDVTLRALRILREADLIACEDTRRTARLLAAHGIATPTTSYFEHNERQKGDRLLELLRAGRKIALVSDAGTPGISDPGYRLVKSARDEGLTVIPVPGPSAVATAVSVSGLPTDRFLFVGFLPRRAGERRRALRALVAVRETLVFYESPVRTTAMLADALAELGDREAFLFREATKVHEEYRRGRLSDIRSLLLERGQVKGEVVVVVAGLPGDDPAAAKESPHDLVARLLQEGLTRRQAAKQVAARLGLAARDVYRMTLEPRD